MSLQKQGQDLAPGDVVLIDGKQFTVEHVERSANNVFKMVAWIVRFADGGGTFLMGKATKVEVEGPAE